jgi:hypothetical protein
MDSDSSSEVASGHSGNNRGGAMRSIRYPLRVALIVDGTALWRWAVEALAIAIRRDRIEIAAVVICSSPRQRNFRAFVRTPRAAERQPFEHLLEGNVATIVAGEDGLRPASRTKLASLGLDVAISFAPPARSGKFPARYGVLSWSHLLQDRPLAFDELESDARCVAVSIQRLSPLGTAETLAQGSFRIERHSWRETQESVLSGAACLLDKALARCAGPHPAARPAASPDDRSPGFARMARLLGVVTMRKVQRILGGGFRRKAWRLLETDRPASAALAGDLSIRAETLPLPGDTDFMADAFYLDPDGSEIVCERMPKGAAFGAIAHLRSQASSSGSLLGASQKHFSYPCVVKQGDRLFLLPEVADWSAPFLIQFDSASGSAGPEIPLKGLEGERLLDPTLIVRDNAFFLFASPARRYRQLDTLLLFVADRLDGPYRPHPMNPIVIDPASARPGGRIQELDGQLLRFGQDNSRGYGAGICVARIDTLTPDDYREQKLGRIRLAGMEGPHTVDFSTQRMIMDGYRNEVDPLAFVAKLRPRPFRF